MCGFIGEIHNDQIEAIKEPIWSKAIAAIHHRGPDSTGHFIDKYVQFGFKRLSIIDLEHGTQPFNIQNRYIMVFNGEIYNYIELRNQLISEGFSFNTDSDTEVLLSLFISKGIDCVKELRGMFSFAIWDKVEQTLFCARDAFGIKPFYYTETSERLFFASEQKSIYAYINFRELSKEAFQYYLTYQYVPEPHCLSKEIKKLLPGHYMIKEINKPPVIKRYFKKTFDPIKSSMLEHKTKIRHILEDSVEKHMRSDVPVGAFLSSGIDSTSIVALAKKHNSKLKTFTVGFENKGFSEVDVAKDTAEKLQVENIHKIISADEFIKELPSIIWHMDDPVADPAAVPLYFVAKEASKHVKVVLSGEGADELFGGYNIYREPISLNWFGYMPTQLKSMLQTIALGLPHDLKGKSYLLRGTTPLSDRYIGNAFVLNETEKKQLLQGYNNDFPFQNITKDLYQEATHYDDSLKMQFIDLHTWLPGDILVKADRMTMAHSLELRVPFLDKDVFKVASEIPTSAKISHGTTKYILREAMKDILPETVLHRRKLGFPVPIRHWLKDELYDWARTIIIESSTEYLFNKGEVLKLLQQHAQSKADNSRKIWVILCFMIWHSIYLENATFTSELTAPELQTV
ncbi:asparagine synthase (glutamine-hydrolyzing) [Halalkalibacter akibai]|uniref:asparagine synthase (glutamine-hydrolyzing) n=1 Tax=Halalkalibacter akibai (strain ATCC 43226 / DSM 21942 / CIP 109018 / JCM 9157 / 1139) TaxID=1236973 RepID=W4QRW6_HALA3|nr:asparagine synthase (glutamine-hydrolyzing) [Halalkalibacter akibai]GAE34383.1 asparagine synthetase [Halalkalibacter akibai JCM 9157]